MSALAEIVERRARLLAEAQAQRQALAEGIDVCRSVLVVVDRGIAWATWLRARPYLVVAAAAAIAVLAAVAGLCIALAVILLVFFLVVLFWDTNRLLAIGVLAGVFAIGGIAACVGLRAAISQRPKFLSATLAELRKDRTKLEG